MTIEDTSRSKAATYYPTTPTSITSNADLTSSPLTYHRHIPNHANNVSPFHSRLWGQDLRKSAHNRNPLTNRSYQSHVFQNVSTFSTDELVSLMLNSAGKLLCQSKSNGYGETVASKKSLVTSFENLPHETFEASLSPLSRPVVQSMFFGLRAVDQQPGFRSGCTHQVAVLLWLGLRRP